MRFLLVVLLCVIIAGNSQAQNFGWAHGHGSAVQDEGHAIAVDALGNVYTTGTFRDAADFDPGPDSLMLTSNGGSDVFIQKLDGAGKLIWAYNVGSTAFDIVNAITVDIGGNVYVAGSFSGTGDFNPDTLMKFELTATGIDDAFVLKLNPFGRLIWAKHMGGLTTDEACALAVDGSGNVFTAGRFQGTCYFEADTASNKIVAGGPGDDLFICKLSEAGKLVWAKGIGTSGNDNCLGIALNSLGQVVMTGFFSGTVDFDPGSGTTELSSNGGYESYIAKFDGVGNFLWAKQFGSTGFDVGYSVTTDAAGNVYATGRFEGTTDFDPGAGTANLVSTGQQDAYICKLDKDGNYMWAKGIGSPSPEWGQSIALDSKSNVYATGFYQGTVDFDPGAGVTNLTSVGGEDIFVCKFDADGNFGWAQGFGGSNANFGDRGQSIAVDATGNVYTTGWFFGSADFDPGAGTFTIDSQGSFDIFTHKISALPADVEQPGSNHSVFVYPNPSQNVIHVELPEATPSVQVQLINTLGQTLTNESYTDTKNMRINVDATRGMYLLRIITADGLYFDIKVIRD